ncbi:DNA polymerase alpha subunit B [Nymphon striatum]|nr:DNA polymerase alpha subunit B [Nymphon striatum]
MLNRIEEIESELQIFNVKSNEETLKKLWFLVTKCHQYFDELLAEAKERCLEKLSVAYLKKRPYRLPEGCWSSNLTTENEEDGVLDMYFTPEAKSKKKVQNTTDNTRSQSIFSSDSPLNNFSPSSFSPKCMTPSRKYKSKLHLVEIVCKFGETEKTTWKNSRSHELVDISNLNDGQAPLTKSYPFMFEKLRSKAAVLDGMIDNLAENISKKFSIENWSNVRQAQSIEVAIVGQICCDGVGKMNPSSILVEGSQTTSGGATVLVDVKNIPEFSFFPGQIVGFKGINQSGKTFIAKELLAPSFPPIFRSENGQALQVVIACGPFKTKDSISFEPLYDLMKYVVEHKPHICILLGPFLDSKNEEIEKGNFGETYEELFHKIVTNLIKMTECAGTHLVIVPSSCREVHHEFIYPCPPFDISELEDVSRLHFVSDPCLLDINGVLFALTSTDILLHLGKEEIWFPPSSSDRLKRLVAHLITQQSFYPLYPPSEEINIDYDHAKSYINFPVKPHILITPSDLKSFIKDVDGCCCINPERLTKGMLGGTFCRMNIKSSQSNTTSGSIISQLSAEKDEKETLKKKLGSQGDINIKEEK